MKRQVLLDHLRATHFETGDRERAFSNARRIARFLRSNGARRVIGIGSTFDPTRPFTRYSDIDLVVEGITPEVFFSVTARAAAMTEFDLDVTPMESATPARVRIVEEEGVDL